MQRFFISLSYNGTTFNGWQIQSNTPNTIQQVIEDKMSMILKERIELVGCGRTDTGVSAKNYVAHFDTMLQDIHQNKEHWIYKFNTVLPESISINDIYRVKPSAHARFDAIERTYYYHVHQHKNPFINQFSTYIYGELDFELMNKAALILLEHSDFTSFSKLHAQTKTNNCKITRAVWQKTNINEWRFVISADRFLRGMVRAIVGTLILVGKNKITLDDFNEIIKSKDRSKAGNNMAPEALFLTRIKYPETIHFGN